MARSAEGAGDVLALLRRGEAGTTSELALALGVSRSTITQRLESLAALGLVAPDATTSGARGRPAASFRFEATAAVVLAAHTGVTGTMLALTDLAGGVLAERRVRSDVLGTLEDAVDPLGRATVELLAEAGRHRRDLAGIGAGFLSTLELAQHRRTSGSAADWGRDDFQALLGERMGVPAFVARDVTMMALAEQSDEWRDAGVLVCIKLGTAITSAIVANGLPIEGAGGFAGELGHLKVRDSAEPCGCGSIGCLDAVAGGGALVRQLTRAGYSVDSVSEVVALAERGEPEVALAVRNAGRRIGEVLAGVVNLLNPDVICTWGYLADADTQLFAGIREGLYQYALPASSADLAIVRTSHGEKSGVRAAASMVIAELLDPVTIDSRVAAVGRMTATGR